MLMHQQHQTTLHVALQVEFWRKGPSHQQEEQDWLSHERPTEAVDTVEAAIAGSGAMMTADMAR